jgi:hypothetical protein
VADPQGSSSPAPEDRLRITLDDDTVERLRAGAERLGLDFEPLVLELLVAASRRIEELLTENG